MDTVVEHLQALIERQEPEPAEAIIWLQGDQFDRGRKVLELWHQGYAPLIVLSGNNQLIGKGPRPGEDNIPLTAMKTWLQGEGVPDATIIVDDQSLNTRGQAEHVLDLALARGWQKLILVGSTHHQLRPFLTFVRRAREVGWQGQIINQPVAIPWDSIPSGRDLTAREIFAEEVEKLTRYAEHVATVQEGLDYLG